MLICNAYIKVALEMLFDMFCTVQKILGLSNKKRVLVKQTFVNMLLFVLQLFAGFGLFGSVRGTTLVCVIADYP